MPEPRLTEGVDLKKLSIGDVIGGLKRLSVASFLWILGLAITVMAAAWQGGRWWSERELSATRAPVAALSAPSTDPWWDSKQWQVDANDFRFGWREAADTKSDHMPATMDRRGILVLAAGQKTPAVLTYHGPLGATVSSLIVEVSGATYGDCEIRVYGNGIQLTPSAGSPTSATGNVVDGHRWYTLTFDVRHLPHDNPHLELRVYAGGSNTWWYETAFIDSISLS